MSKMGRTPGWLSSWSREQDIHALEKDGVVLGLNATKNTAAL